MVLLWKLLQKIKLVNIQKQSRKTYERVVSGLDKNLTKNSCSFLLLEKACIEYQRQSDDEGAVYDLAGNVER